MAPKVFRIYKKGGGVVDVEAEHLTYNQHGYIKLESGTEPTTVAFINQLEVIIVVELAKLKA